MLPSSALFTVASFSLKSSLSGLSLTKLRKGDYNWFLMEILERQNKSEIFLFRQIVKSFLFLVRKFNPNAIF